MQLGRNDILAKISDIVKDAHVAVFRIEYAMHSLILDIGKEKWKAAGGLRSQNGQEKKDVKGRVDLGASDSKESKDGAVDDDGGDDDDLDGDCDDGFESDDDVVGRSSSILGQLPL